jgi:spermidine/putrescine-binding protein
LLCLLIPVFSLNSCSANNKIVFANYESYFSTDLIKKYQDDVNFLYFQSDSDIRAKFRQSYDIAVPSNAEALRYLKEGWLSQID